MNFFNDILIPLIRQAIIVEEKETSKPLEILLVEDSTLDVDLVRDTFTEHKLHIASTFQEALTLIRELKVIDIAFVDLNVPGGHGMDLVNRISFKHPKARIAATPGDASVLRPGDEGWVIMKHPRMAKSFKEFLEKKNGHENGNNHKISYKRLFLIFVTFGVLIWVAGENKWIEQLVNYIKKL